MIILTYRSKEGLRLAVRTPRGIFDVTPSPDDFFRQGLSALPALREEVARRVEDPGTAILNEGDLELGPCVPQPGKILCVGLNYLRHAQESGMSPPETPVLFSKFGNTIAASGEAIPLPDNAREYDYEAELVVVIGRRARYVKKDEALDFVLGYCNGNDLSARDLQMRTGQWLLGKTLDKFMPIGPYLVTADEAEDPGAMSVRCWLNGELRQDSSTSDLIFSVADLVHYASQYLTLEPGDIISTGTPEGVILGRADKIWLKPGDEVTVEIGSLGRLQNHLIAEE